jgi:16S rRNA (cytidine1402-2'-O)-methyltransferase
LLTVVPTPIGNLQDITLRALQALREADLIAAEDTRRSAVLLLHHNIRKPMISLHEHNEEARTAELVKEIARGRSIVLITDAGMPGISDPGFRLIRACREGGLTVNVLPGPSAVLTALVGSGLPTSAFHFGGFLPVKSGRRRAELEQAVTRTETNVYFESPHRLVKTLEVLTEIAPEAHVCVARELTKKFEEYRRGRPADLYTHYAKHPPKGEITLVISHAGGEAARKAAAKAESARTQA